MGDHLKKVQSGDPLKIPAATFNAFIDAARHVQGLQHGLGGNPQAGQGDIDVVTVKNATGGDYASRLMVLGVDTPLFARADSPDLFDRRVLLQGETPSEAAHRGRFVVTLEPVAAGELCRAIIAGVTPVQVYVLDIDHGYADVRDGDGSTLVSQPYGGAEILWKEPGLGTKWAIVRLGNHPGVLGWGKAAADQVLVAGNGSYVNVHPCDREAAVIDTTRTVKVWLPRGGRDEDPNVKQDNVIPFVHAGAGEGVVACDVLDGKIDKSVRIWLDKDNIPQGWSVFASGRFLVGYDPGDGDYDTVGAAGGYTVHGGGTNDHADHNLEYNDEGAYIQPYPYEGNHDPDPGLSHTQTDNRPPYQVVVWIKRTN